MRIGDYLCPWHPGMTLFECKQLHEAVDTMQAEVEAEREDSGG
jgi:hypothetical protein